MRARVREAVAMVGGDGGAGCGYNGEGGGGGGGEGVRAGGEGGKGKREGTGTKQKREPEGFLLHEWDFYVVGEKVPALEQRTLRVPARSPGTPSTIPSKHQCPTCKKKSPITTARTFPSPPRS